MSLISLRTLKRVKTKAMLALAATRRRLCHADAPVMVTAEVLFSEDLERLSADVPGWDEPMREAGARRLLDNGVPLSKVRQIYGEATVDSALGRASQ
jgi:hypothetical protein